MCRQSKSLGYWIQTIERFNENKQMENTIANKNTNY